MQWDQTQMRDNCKMCPFVKFSTAPNLLNLSISNLLNKFLRLYHFNCEITQPISGRSVDLLLLRISQEDFCLLIFRLISIKVNLCPSLSDHLLAARKHCTDGKNIMSALHKKPLIAPLEEMSVYFDQEGKVNVKKVKFGWIFKWINLLGTPCCVRFYQF